MTIVASVLVVVVLIAVVIAVIAGPVIILRRGSRPRRSRSNPNGDNGGTGQPPAFGPLPSLADPIGPLGNLSPDSDISSAGADEHDLYGE